LQNNDPTIQVMLISCFGGMLNVSKVASSIAIMAKVGVEFKKPIVIRLRGEGEIDARLKLRDVNIDNVYVEEDYEKSVKLAVKLAKGIK